MLQSCGLTSLGDEKWVRTPMFFLPVTPWSPLSKLLKALKIAPLDVVDHGTHLKKKKEHIS